MKTDAENKGTLEDDDLECNYCGSTDGLEMVPWAPGFWFCRECRERFELQDQMIKQGLEIQPEIE